MVNRGPTLYTPYLKGTSAEQNVLLLLQKKCPKEVDERDFARAAEAGEWDLALAAAGATAQPTGDGRV